MRLNFDSTPHTSGTVIADEDDYRTISRGEIKISARSSVYQIHETFFKNTGNTELTLVGPRGAGYILHGYDSKTGVYRAISLGSGSPMMRQGNEVLFIILGGEFTVTSKSELLASRRRGK